LPDIPDSGFGNPARWIVYIELNRHGGRFSCPFEFTLRETKRRRVTPFHNRRMELRQS
jgi:hypothetical protein